MLPLLGGASPEESSVLQGFRYGAVDVVMHQDPRAMPPQSSQWAPVNYVLSQEHDRPMVSIWVNHLLPTYTDMRPVFQTINPQTDIDAALVLQHSRFERPIADLGTAALLRRLNTLHCQADRRVFFCGSYAAHGIPLLESAVASAMQVTQKILGLTH